MNAYLSPPLPSPPDCEDDATVPRWLLDALDGQGNREELAIAASVRAYSAKLERAKEHLLPVL